MKRSILAACAALALAAPAGADPLGDRIERLPTAEWVYQGLHAADTALTIDCTGRDVCEEANPFLGRHPGTGKLLAFWAGTAIAHAGFTMALQDIAPRAVPIFERVSIAIGAGIVAANLRFAFK
jgi:hypothetical protein